MIGFPLDSHVTYKGDGTPVYDRAISSAPLRKIFKKLLTDGVLPNPSNNMKVQAGTGMQVIVNPGFANVDGCLKLEDSQRTLVVQASSTSYDRIDTVVLRLDANDDVRECDFYIVAGTPASTPVRPSLSRGESIYEIGLADVFVGANSTAITNDKITDTRLETARCGVISSISEFDTDNIYDQIMADLASFKANEQAEFLAWFEDLKNILDDNAAANLQNEIGTLTLLSTTAKSNLVAAINEVKSDADSGIASVESDVSTLESSMTTAQSDITALNQSLAQSLVDIDLKFDTTTNKPMYRRHGVGNFVNFSSGVNKIKFTPYISNSPVNYGSIEYYADDNLCGKGITSPAAGLYSLLQFTTSKFKMYYNGSGTYTFTFYAKCTVDGVAYADNTSWSVAWNNSTQHTIIFV